VRESRTPPKKLFINPVFFSKIGFFIGLTPINGPLFSTPLRGKNVQKIISQVLNAASEAPFFHPS
jgi:hypothetical protein